MRKTEVGREDKVLRFKCLSVLKHILEQRSYISFEREMYYMHYTGIDVGTVDHSTYFVDKLLETLAIIFKKAIHDDFCTFDEVTQSYPDFSLAADGLTDREKTGETVVLTKFCGDRTVNFPVHLKKHKRSRSWGPDSSGLIRNFELALGICGLDDDILLFDNLVSSVLDGAEQFKVEYPLMEKIMLVDYDDNYSRRSELPEANIVEWCKVHPWELVAKDMIKLDPIVSTLEKTVKALRRFFASGKAGGALEDACNDENNFVKNPKFLKLCKTRFSEHHLKAYLNSFQRLPQLSAGLLKAKRKKKQRKLLQQQIVSKRVVACNYGIADLFQLIANNFKSLQDESQPPWVYVKKYDATMRTLDKMKMDLQKKTNLLEKFCDFPRILKKQTIFTKGFEVYEMKTKEKVTFQEFQLGEATPTWDANHPDWLDEDDWTEESESESEEEVSVPSSGQRKRSRKSKKCEVQGKLSLTKNELEHIKKDPEGTEIEIVGCGNELADFVAKRLLFTIVRLRKIAYIRVGKRIRKIHRVSVCHDFENLYTKKANLAEFLGHALDGLCQLVKIESRLLQTEEKKPRSLFLENRACPEQEPTRETSPQISRGR